MKYLLTVIHWVSVVLTVTVSTDFRTETTWNKKKNIAKWIRYAKEVGVTSYHVLAWNKLKIPVWLLARVS